MKGLLVFLSLLLLMGCSENYYIQRTGYFEYNTYSPPLGGEHIWVRNTK